MPGRGARRSHAAPAMRGARRHGEMQARRAGCLWEGLSGAGSGWRERLRGAAAGVGGQTSLPALRLVKLSPADKRLSAGLHS